MRCQSVWQGAAAAYDFMRAVAAEMALVMFGLMLAHAADSKELLSKTICTAVPPPLNPDLLFPCSSQFTRALICAI